MSGYQRRTRTCNSSDLDPALSEAIRAYFQLHQIGDAELDVITGCETVAEKNPASKAGNFLGGLLDEGRDNSFHLAILLTKDWLVWARSGDQSERIVNGARLPLIKVKAFVSKRNQNMQLEVTGYMNDGKESVRGNLQMGPEPAAQKFCEAVGKAVENAHPPSPRKLPKWLGG